MEQPINQFDSAPKNSSPLIPVIIAVILTAIIVGGGIYWWANQKQTEFSSEILSLHNQVDQLKQIPATPPTDSNNQSDELIEAMNQKQAELNNEISSLRTQIDQLKQVSVPTPTPKDETASWITYQNKKYGFEVKYPLNWFYIDCDSSYIGFSYSQSKLPTCFTDQNQPHINIKVTEGSTVGIEKYIEDTQHSIDNYSKATITINGNISATKFTGLVKSEEGPGPAGGLQTIKVLFSRNNDIYQAYYYGLDNEDYSQIFNQILSAFKFTN